jgi:hypothetical protein
LSSTGAQIAQKSVVEGKHRSGWLTGLTAVSTLSCVAILVAGYHGGMEDDAIYLPGIKKLLNPSLYPHDTQFFESQTKAFLLLRAVAASVRITHIPLEWMQFFWYVISVVALIAGCWYVASQCFQALRDRIGAVALVAPLLTMPVAGTALYIADQHLHPRTLAAALILFAIGAVLQRRHGLAVLCAVLALVVHPLMASFGICYLVVLALPLERWTIPTLASRTWGTVVRTGMLATLPLPIITRPNAAWREAALTRSYFFLWRWEWYEWLGIFGPMVLLWWFGKVGEKIGSPALAKLCRRLVVFSVIMSAAGMVVGLPRQLDWLAPVQPMRHLQLVYLLMLLVGGGLLAHFVLHSRAWRWMVLFVPLCGGMLYAQIASFATSPHIELPFMKPTNRWVRSFRWISDNTPKDAYFAVSPEYMDRPGEEYIGFRGIAERSKLADYSQDGAVVAVVPDLAPVWKKQVDAMKGYESFTREDFLRLKTEFGVDWALVEKVVPGMTCPYQQDGLAVCRIEQSRGLSNTRLEFGVVPESG